jgi:hypothetical protein
MRRPLVVAVTIGALVAAVAACVLISRFSASRRGIDGSSGAVGDVTDIPIALQRRADCMYQALTKIPGVQNPRQGRVTTRGWAHPFVEYSATISPYVEYRAIPIQFEAQRDGRSHDEYWYWFLASFAGPLPPGFDLAQMQSIMQIWRVNCHVWVEFETN